jgi:hypothetical protein
VKDIEFQKLMSEKIQAVTGTKFNQETVYSEQTSAHFSRCTFNLFTLIDVAVKHRQHY